MRMSDLQTNRCQFPLLYIAEVGEVLWLSVSVSFHFYILQKLGRYCDYQCLPVCLSVCLCTGDLRKLL